LRAWIADWLTLFAPGDARGEESSIFALRLWPRASFAARAVGLITASWLVRPQRESLRQTIQERLQHKTRQPKPFQLSGV